MGAALEILTGFTTAPGTTITALTLAAGNSATIRNAPLEVPIKLLQAWGDHQTAGLFRIRSPRLHDSTQGIRLRVTASDASPLLPWGFNQRLYPQDLLTLENTGSATAGDIETECLLIYYQDLPGVAGRFIAHEDVMRRMVHLVTVENTLALGTAGGYSGEEAINAEFDVLRANTDYALLGAIVDTECAVVRYRGADTGNVGVGVPGNETLRHVTADWFMRLSKAFGIPLIPVFNSANRAGFLLDGAQDENGADPLVISIFAELSAAPAAR